MPRVGKANQSSTPTLRDIKEARTGARDPGYDQVFAPSITSLEERQMSLKVSKEVGWGFSGSTSGCTKKGASRKKGSEWEGTSVCPAWGVPSGGHKGTLT